MEYLHKPHFYAHILSSIAMVISIMILIVYYKKIKSNYVNLIQIFAVLSIAMAAHGQSYTTLEKEYGYNPLKKYKEYVSSNH